MNISESKLWISDIDEVTDALPALSELSGKGVMITGCGGLICSAVVDVLIRWNETHDEKIKIYAAGRNREKVMKRFEPFTGRGWFEYVQYDATSEDNKLPDYCDYIIHGAGNASPNNIVKEPVETMLGNITGMKSLLEYARAGKAGRILLISSSEVYGKKESDRPNKVDEYGSIDILDPRSSYSVGKCAAETLCVSYGDEYGVDSVIIRPGHIYGPTASETDNRVSSAWAYAVSRGEDIVMKSDGSQIRSYCYCLDCASAILTVLLKGEKSQAYNISNPESVISIKEMAELLAESAGVSLKMELPTDAEKKGFNPMKNSSLDATELESLGWKGQFDAGRGFAHTVEIIKEIKGKENHYG
ncbi:MAG: NAD-dependent epimerase/dehydratase family protein [Lachnospiraceae bacterium]|nr:NAD-dependent epimerase/dehydratase family protein [Lachnospiraceae bacterium]